MEILSSLTVAGSQAFETAGAVKGINTQATGYTLVLADAGKTVELNSATAVALTVPTNAAVAFAVGSYVNIVQYGAGQVTITPASGVTIRSAGGYLSRAQYSMISLYKRAADEWVMGGDTTGA